MESGYDVILKHEADSRFMCPICLLVLREAVQTSCGHRFCEPCIKKVIQNKGSALTCPVDKTFSRVDQIFPDVAIRREIRSLHVICSNFEEGCIWKGELREVEKHRNTCDMEEVKCPHGCKVTTKRSQLANHVSQCPSRQVQCSHCEASVVHYLLETHLEKCPKFPVTCDLCGAAEILRERVADHQDPIMGSCPKVVIGCPYSFAGCDYKAERTQVQEHTSRPEALKEHMELVAYKLEFHHKVIEQLQESIEDISKKTKNMYPIVMLTDRREEQLAKKIRERNVTGKLHWKVKMGNNFRNRTSYCGPSFYTGCPGYRVQLSLDMDGPRDGHIKYTSMSVSLLPGEYDDEIVFPFNATCFVTLYDQSSNPSQRVNFSHQIVMREVPRNHRAGGSTGDRIYRRETSRFMKRPELMGNSSRFLKHGCLHFEVSVIHSFYPPLEGSHCPGQGFPSVATHGSLIVHTPACRPNSSRNDSPQAQTPVMSMATLAIGN